MENQAWNGIPTHCKHWLEFWGIQIPLIDVRANLDTREAQLLEIHKKDYDSTLK